ncbi:MAG TPA: DUF4249 domain-containing protein [Flavobacterium sp.]|nr:DUF4249 domain-containing protein [Flavobacterium sp.]
MRKLFFKITILASLCVLTGCTEQYALQTDTFEDAIVVEATITNELKNQEIKISRTYKLEENGPQFESGATVNVTDDSGNQYDFEENAGTYISQIPFQAIPGRSYQLNIITNKGISYTSSPEILTPVNPIIDVVPSVQVRDGIRGVEINVSSYDPTASSKYYRYKYEETYKIIAPKWSPSQAVVSGEAGNYEIDLVPHEGETRTCYSTKNSTDIILTNTSGLSEDRVYYPIRFISNKNYIITHRYSILVTQYIQNLASYTYYKTLRETSGSGSILSQNQPGFFYGNLKSENPNEKVIGFFEVSSVSSKRMFFNYVDLFPGEKAPPYFTKCDIQTFGFCFDYALPECDGYNLISAIQTNSLLYYSGANDTYNMVIPPCGDCTTFSSNIKPSFWTD